MSWNKRNNNNNNTTCHFKVSIYLRYEQFLVTCFTLVGHEVHPHSDERMSECPDVPYSDVCNVIVLKFAVVFLDV
jgi:hypothetical protein